MIEDLSSVLLTRSDSLEKAALLLSENSLQIVLVVNEDRKLLGIVIMRYSPRVASWLFNNRFGWKHHGG